MSAEEQARTLAAGFLIAVAVGMLVIAAVDRHRRLARRDAFLAACDQALDLATGAVRCGECADVLDDINRAPSCLSHDTCLACAPTPYCTECARELDYAGLLEWPWGEVR